jgi:serine-type D-Ala-D-Ala carboxypeptidase
MIAAPAAVVRALDDAIARRVTPGAVVEVGTPDGPLWRVTSGRLTYADAAPAVTAATVYDLASLTKVIATTTLAMDAHASGSLPLDAVANERVGLAASRPPIAIRDLLEHAAGFPAHRPYYREIAGRAAYRTRIAGEPPAYVARTRSEYSDLGFMLLGLLLEDTSGHTLDVQFDAFAREVLGDAEIAFGVRPAWLSRVAPTSVDWWRARVIAAHAHDGNAAALGGVAGHAGLFGTATAVGAFAQWWLGLWTGGGAPWRRVTSSIVETFARRGAVPGSSRALGWDTMLPTSSCGTKLSPRAIGHTGFTGTSLWIDPDRRLYVVCLTNRVHPSADSDAGIRALRIALHEAVADVEG